MLSQPRKHWIISPLWSVKGKQTHNWFIFYISYLDRLWKWREVLFYLVFVVNYNSLLSKIFHYKMFHKKCITVEPYRWNNFSSTVCTYTQKLDTSDPIMKIYLTLIFPLLWGLNFNKAFEVLTHTSAGHFLLLFLFSCGISLNILAEYKYWEHCMSLVTFFEKSDQEIFLCLLWNIYILYVFMYLLHKYVICWR